MARGQRDYGAYAAETYLGAVSDMAELAVRLGSSVIFDRRGKVMYIDDCEGTVLKFFVTAIGGAAVLSAVDPLSGSQGIELNSGALANQYVVIEKRFPPLSSQHLGIEFVFAERDTDTNLLLGITYDDGTDTHSAQIRIDFNAGLIEYWVGGLAFVTRVNYGAFHGGTFLHYPIKLVADFSTGYFTRLLFAGTEYDMSAIPIITVLAAGAIPHLRFWVRLERRVAAGGLIYLDDFILTEDEP